MLQALGGAALADGVDALLGGLQGLLGGGGALLHHAGDGTGGVRHTAQQGLVPDNADVLLHIGGGGGDEDELLDIVIGGVLVVDAVLLHLVQHGHRIHGLGVVEHGADALEDIPVLPQVEVLRLQGLHHGGDTALVDEHGAKHSLLGLHRVGGLAGEKLVHRGSPPGREK